MGNGLLLVGRTLGGGIDPLVIAAVFVVVVGAVGTAVAAVGTAGTAGLTAGDCETAFSSLTGSAGDPAATALRLCGRACSVVTGVCETARCAPFTAGDCRCSACWPFAAAETL